MLRHLSKLIVFLGIQAGLFCTLQWYVRDHDASAENDSLADARLASFVKSCVRPAWESNPRLIEQALYAGEDHGLIADLVRRFISGPNHYVAAARDKDQRLRTTPGERIILIGGSNIAFSIDSRILEERYGLAPVNMGLQAPLGIRFMTRHVAEYVRSGDVVIVAIEPMQMWEDPDGQGDAPATLCRVCPELAWLYHPESKASPKSTAISWTDRKRYSDCEALAEFARTTRECAQQLLPDPPKTSEQISQAAATAEFDRCVQPLLEAVQRRYVSLDPVYVRSGFNEYGDMTRHRTKTRSAKIPTFSTDFEADRIAAVKLSARILNDFADRCQEGGATVYFAYPPLLRTQGSERLAPQYESVLKSSIEFPILFPIDDAFVEDRDVYDTAFHLTWKGTCKRMQTLCIALDRQLTPQTRLSVGEHIAARDRAEQQSFVMANRSEQSQRY